MKCQKGRGDRAVEGARLEIVCTPKEYRGFESPPLRQMRTGAMKQIRERSV